MTDINAAFTSTRLILAGQQLPLVTFCTTFPTLIVGTYISVLILKKFELTETGVGGLEERDTCMCLCAKKDETYLIHSSF